MIPFNFIYTSCKFYYNTTDLKVVLVDDTFSFSQPVDGVIGFTHSPEVTADGVGDVGASDSAGFVNFGDVELDAGVVFDSDESAGGGAFSWVEFHFFG